MTCQVPRSTLAPCTRTRTSFSPIGGLSIVSTRRTSSGAGPYASWTIATILSGSAVIEGGSIASSGGEGMETWGWSGSCSRRLKVDAGVGVVDVLSGTEQHHAEHCEQHHNVLGN